MSYYRGLGGVVVPLTDVLVIDGDCKFHPVAPSDRSGAVVIGECANARVAFTEEALQALASVLARLHPSATTAAGRRSA